MEKKKIRSVDFDSYLDRKIGKKGTKERNELDAKTEQLIIAEKHKELRKKRKM